MNKEMLNLEDNVLFRDWSSNSSEVIRRIIIRNEYAVV
jgi:hypothetical protein